MPSSDQRVEAKTTPVQLAPVRPERRLLEIFNAAASRLRIRLGANPTATLFTHRLEPGGFWDRATPDSVFGEWDVADPDGGEVVTEHYS